MAAEERQGSASRVHEGVRRARLEAAYYEAADGRGYVAFIATPKFSEFKFCFKALEGSWLGYFRLKPADAAAAAPAPDPPPGALLLIKQQSPRSAKALDADLRIRLESRADEAEASRRGLGAFPASSAPNLWISRDAIEREPLLCLASGANLSTLALTNTMSRENAAPEATPNEASAPKPNPLAKAKSFDGVETVSHRDSSPPRAPRECGTVFVRSESPRDARTMSSATQR